MKRQAIDVLLIEDDDVDAEIVKRALGKSQSSFRVCRATTLAQALATAESQHVDVILTDLTLPDSGCSETPAKIRQSQPLVPLIILTGLASRELAEELLEAGAQDYVVKDSLSSDCLERSIRHAIQRQHNCIRIRELLDELEVKQELLETNNRKLTRLYSQAHEFVDNVSHEFRTPLTVIKEYTSLMREGLVGSVSDEQSRLLSVVEDRADDLNIMVDDMLDNSKLEAGMLCAWRKECSVAEIIDRVRNVLQRKADVRQVSLQWDVSEPTTRVYCDAEKAGRVITNLAINAIKFCGSNGTVQIAVHAEATEQEVWIRISDNGPGIDETALAEICQRFTQVSTHDSEETKGFGLGLNIAQQLVQLNFGELSIQSQPTVGSTFSFSIPMSNPFEIVKRYLNQIDLLQRADTDSDVVSMIACSVDETADPASMSDVDRFLNCRLRRNDILLRSQSNRWVLALPLAEDQLEDHFSRLQSERLTTNRNRPHGPLPNVNFESLGSWRVVAQRSQILDCVVTEFSSDRAVAIMASECVDGAFPAALQTSMAEGI
ncbi:Signal transduction histidine-protein kinase BarA [Rosistilla oblonga]|uniref:hybrid sensor histidine kinase/response regulator n=1 Tax=Rosistilla oblonga TaxID=2527990 RepID=UPI00118873F8|nr:hybrid sensor histidine kinase/response regulator [Rosistilla oblonga]QDV15226.1 Signal transduction histidine-protein kinase BarA [Rosistilla oblonga]